MAGETQRFRNFTEWLETVPKEIKGDALWLMPVYQQALYASDLAWADIARIRRTMGTRDLADQLYRAVCSVSANIAEGYSRSSGKERRHFYEYALGSARESRDWYYKARPSLNEPVASHRIGIQTEIIKQLLTLIPLQTHFSIREEGTEYLTSETGT